MNGIEVGNAIQVAKMGVREVVVVTTTARVTAEYRLIFPARAVKQIRRWPI
jgi:hypothetical protein